MIIVNDYTVCVDLRHTWRQSIPRAWRTGRRSTSPVRSCRSLWYRSWDPPSRDHRPGQSDTGNPCRTAPPAPSPPRLHTHTLTAVTISINLLLILLLLRSIFLDGWKQTTNLLQTAGWLLVRSVDCQSTVPKHRVETLDSNINASK